MAWLVLTYFCFIFEQRKKVKMWCLSFFFFFFYSKWFITLWFQQNKECLETEDLISADLKPSQSEPQTLDTAHILCQAGTEILNDQLEILFQTNLTIQSCSLNIRLGASLSAWFYFRCHWRFFWLLKLKLFRFHFTAWTRCLTVNQTVQFLCRLAEIKTLKSTYVRQTLSISDEAEWRTLSKTVS